MHVSVYLHLLYTHPISRNHIPFYIKVGMINRTLDSNDRSRVKMLGSELIRDIRVEKYPSLQYLINLDDSTINHLSKEFGFEFLMLIKFRIEVSKFVGLPLSIINLDKTPQLPTYLGLVLENSQVDEYPLWNPHF